MTFSQRLPLVLLCTVGLVGPWSAGCGGRRQPPAAAPQAAAPAAAPTAAPEAAAAPAAGEADVAALLERLRGTTDSRDRVLVIDEIATLASRARPGLDALLAALADAEPRVRWHAARAIGLIGEDARPALPALVKLLGDEDPITVAQAAAAIGHIRFRDKRVPLPAADAAAYAAAVDPLVATAVHADPRARRAALRALERVSESPEKLAPLFAKQLADADPAVATQALHTLADLGSDAVPFLLEVSKDPKARYWATLALGTIGPEAAPATAALATIAAEGELEERLQAILALAAIGEPAAASAPALVKALESPEHTLRAAAAFALGSTRARVADDQLARVAASADDPLLAATAAWARARINPDDGDLRAAAAAKLVAGLKHPDPEIRSACVSGLSDLAAGMKDAEQGTLAGAFAELLAAPEPAVEQAAGGALVRLGGAGLTAVRAKLADPKVRRNAMQVLAALGPKAAPALPDVVAALAQDDPEFRDEAAMAIAALGPAAAPAVDDLRKLLADEQAGAARYSAAFALGSIGPGAKAAEPMLRELATSADEVMATVAVWAVLKIKPDDREIMEAAVPRLRKALRSERDGVRLEAAVALGDIGGAAATAVPLLELLSDDDPSRDVRDAATAALAKIRGG